MQKVFVFVLRLDASQTHQLVVGNPQGIAQRTQVLFHQFALKRSWPAGTGVCVVKTVCWATSRKASSKRQAVFLHAFANHLQRSKRAMPFIEMIHARRDPQRRKRRTPPTPNTSSWRIRVRSSPP